LIQRNTKPEIHACAQELKKHKPVSIVDIGCGLGQLHQLLSPKPQIYIGIDKAMLSLLIARIVDPNLKMLICADVDLGIPVSDKAVTAVVYLDCFTWIKKKKFSIDESYRILKRNGLLLLANVHDENKKTYWWGYGISMLQTKKYLHLYSNISPLKISKSTDGNTEKNSFSLLAHKSF